MHSLAAMRLDEIIKGMSVDRGEVQGASHGLPNYKESGRTEGYEQRRWRRTNQGDGRNTNSFPGSPNKKVYQ